MWDLVAMWKNPKMIALTLFIALLYVAMLFPFQGFTALGGYADFGRAGVGILVAFSFLFGPAAAWGAAIGNVVLDIAVLHVDAASFFGFFGNLLLGYVPYKLWNAVTAERPDMKGIKKFLLFAGVTISACVVCGITIGWGLYWLGFTPFMPAAALITLTNALWAIVLGSIALAFTYNYVSKHKWLYVDIFRVDPRKPSRHKTQRGAILIFGMSSLVCFSVGAFYTLNSYVLLPFVTFAILAIGIACK